MADVTLVIDCVEKDTKEHPWVVETQKVRGKPTSIFKIGYRGTVDEKVKRVE